MMATALLMVAALTLLFWAGFSIDLIYGSFRTPSLKKIVPCQNNAPPKVSVIIPARNEERNIEVALQSVLRQDYPNLEFFVINDRSTDRTGAILRRMSAADPRLRLVELNELPPGWLGKNYALYFGAQQAGGDLLLFTDADIVMQPATLRLAVAYLTEHHLDHLTLSPDIKMRGVVLGMLTATFFILFSLFARHWKARDPKSSHSVGIGAFNLVLANAYHAAGTHRAIAMRPDDDLKLGRLIKKSGFRQELLFGRGMIAVEWYASFRDMIDGLMKNGFASVNYSLTALILSTVTLFLVNDWPFLGICLTHGSTRILNILSALCALALACGGSRFCGSKWWYGLGYPVFVLIFIGILWRSALRALANGGIDWRGTHYPLDQLRANKV
jgi:glycosyltransferase involved in cell wall biosynthesis